MSLIRHSKWAKIVAQTVTRNESLLKGHFSKGQLMSRDLSEGEGWVVKITIWVLSLPEAAKLKVHKPTQVSI